MKYAVLIPTYNASATVKETLLSVQKNIETNININVSIFVADDFSTDNTLNIVRDTWYLDAKLLHIFPSTKNQGERENLNRVVSKIENDFDWIFIIHADDIAKSNWLSTLVKEIKNNLHVGAVSSSYDDLFEDGDIKEGENKEGIEIIEGNETSIKSTLKTGTWFHISGCAIATKTFQKVGYFQKDLPQYGDMEYVLRMFFNGIDILYIPKSLTLYRQIKSSVSSNSFKRNIDILEYSSLIAHLKYLFNEEELKLLNKRLQYFLNRRIIRSIITLDLVRLLSAFNIKKYVRGVLLSYKDNHYHFPHLISS